MTRRYRIYRAACHGKIAHLTAEQAAIHAQMLNAQQAEGVVVYECDFCCHFHTGHPGKKEKIERIRK